MWEKDTFVLQENRSVADRVTGDYEGHRREFHHGHCLKAQYQAALQTAEAKEPRPACCDAVSVSR